MIGIFNHLLTNISAHNMQTHKRHCQFIIEFTGPELNVLQSKLRIKRSKNKTKLNRIEHELFAPHSIKTGNPTVVQMIVDSSVYGIRTLLLPPLFVVIIVIARTGVYRLSFRLWSSLFEIRTKCSQMQTIFEK